MLLAVKLAPLALAPVLMAGAAVAGLDPVPTTVQPVPSAHAAADIPADYLTWYQQAAATQCDRLPWTVLAAIGKVESDHGRSLAAGVHIGTNIAGARGPMQFLPATFAAYADPPPPGGAVPASPYDPPDAIWAAARMLCHDGAGHGIRAAVYAYNHADWYVTAVLDQAARYATTYPTPNPATPTRVQRALAFARAQIGKPYVWGGDGNPGYDCSGLVHAAYATAGITLPRTAQAQFDTGPHLDPTAPLQPGDLVFYGTPDHIHHVGLYLGAGHMIDAPDTGLTVRIEPVRAPDYAGATRPTAHTPTRPPRAPTPHGRAATAGGRP